MTFFNRGNCVTFHTTLAAIDCNVWLEYVQSGANVADLPSCGKFELLESMGSIPFETVPPPIGEDWTAAFVHVDLLSPCPPAVEGRQACARRGAEPGGTGEVLGGSKSLLALFYEGL